MGPTRSSRAGMVSRWAISAPVSRLSHGSYDVVTWPIVVVGLAARA